MNRLICVLSIFLVVMSCKEEVSKKEYILFSGTISDATSKELKIYNSNRGAKTHRITLDEGGSFNDTLTAGTGRYVFHDSRNRVDLYLTQGGVYNFTTDGKNFRNKAVLTGTNPGASNYLLTRMSRITKLRGDYGEFNSLNESDFSTKSMFIKESMIKYLDSFPNIPEEFAKLEIEELHYYHLLDLIRYEGLHNHFTKQSDFKISEDFLKELDGVNFLKEDLYKRRTSYNSVVAAHFKRKANELEEKEGLDKFFSKLKAYGEISNDYIKNDLLGSAARAGIGSVENLEEYYNTYISVSTSERNQEIITKKYESLKKLSKGQPSPIFTNYENHAGGTTSLSDFKGKYVYIDVWATWCVPCLAEVPFLKKVEKQYHGKNVEFVSVSVDAENKRESWRKMVIDKELSGIQLIADKNFKSDFISAYQISGIPRFILIDPEGKIVDSNAPRPSSLDLINLLNTLKL